MQRMTKTELGLLPPGTIYSRVGSDGQSVGLYRKCKQYNEEDWDEEPLLPYTPCAGRPPYELMRQIAPSGMEFVVYESWDLARLVGKLTEPIDQ